MISDDNFGERDEIYGGIGIQYPPRVCVDYLSHDWKEEDDIWASWKAMKTMSKKKEFANGVRLENASWRTWAKQKYNLKTVSPEKLNWLKDSDVTWLYGPLHKAWSNHIVSPPKSPTTEDKLNLMPSSTKSCLKKKSIAEILRPVLGGRYNSSPLVTSNSDTQLYKKDRDFEVDSDCETSSTCSSISGPTTPTTGPIFLPNEKNSNRKIQFNDHVEQYMVVESEEEDNSDDGIVMKRDCTTITKLAPTKLKEERLHNNEYSALYTNHGRRRATSSKSSSSSTSSASTSTSATQSASTSTSKASTSKSTSTSKSSSPLPSWTADDDDDDDIDYLDFDNFDLNPPTSAQPSSSQNRSRDIIPPYNAFDENQHFPDDDDDIVDKAVNLVRWVLNARNLSIF